PAARSPRPREPARAETRTTAQSPGQSCTSTNSIRARGLCRRAQTERRRAETAQESTWHADRPTIRCETAANPRTQTATPPAASDRARRCAPGAEPRRSTKPRSRSTRRGRRLETPWRQRAAAAHRTRAHSWDAHSWEPTWAGRSCPEDIAARDRCPGGGDGYPTTGNPCCWRPPTTWRRDRL